MHSYSKYYAHNFLLKEKYTSILITNYSKHQLCQILVIFNGFIGKFRMHLMVNFIPFNKKSFEDAEIQTLNRLI